MRTRSARFAILSSVASFALVVASVNPALAAPQAAEAEEPAEGDPPAEGDEPAEAEEPAEGDTPAEGEGEEPAAEDGGEGEGEGEGEAEGEEAEAEGEGEGEAEGEAAAEGEAPVEEAPPPETDVRPEEAEDLRPDEPRVAGKPRTGKGLLIAGGATLGAGIGLTATFAGITRGCSVDGPLQCKHENQDQFLIPLGVSITLLGAMILAVGVGYHLQYRRWRNWSDADTAKERQRREKRERRGRKKSKTAFAPTLFRGGGGISAVGKF